MFRRRGGWRPMRWLPRRHEDHTVEVRAFDRGLRRLEVSDVDGIERPTKHPEALSGRLHGWYSNSTPPMRTESPVSTPAASRASLTPSLSSCDWKSEER